MYDNAAVVVETVAKLVELLALLLDKRPEDKAELAATEFLHKFVKKASRGTTRSRTPHTLVKF